MIINDTVADKVVLSNVSAAGEFRIRNSSKAFKILSDGLYSNKIRAVIRELSCNALDSHVAAGKKSTPFDVHLPSVFEPWFAVRDYGVGLSADQVNNIYTTYFESTKTDSNDFIGALGLGSKSPFSYTDNFTVTATRNSIQNIFSAYINDQGVPSVVQMSSVVTDEPNGVEVKFSVIDRDAFISFRHEATEVFSWFEQHPNVIGDQSYRQRIVDYKEKDIVPGVSQLNNYNHSGSSFAIMGNICYPLNNIPEPDKHFGKLANLLSCALVINFDIGELDFAASREQLSFIPLTLNSIKKKLQALNDNLTGVIKTKFDAITTGEWAQASFLYEQIKSRLFAAAAVQFAVDVKFPLFNATYGNRQYQFELNVEDLTEKKLQITAFNVETGFIHKKKPAGRYNMNKITAKWDIPVTANVVFVLNDLNTGAYSRASYHFQNHMDIPTSAYHDMSRTSVYVVESTEKDVVVRQLAYDKLLKTLHNPPNVVLASTLLAKPPRVVKPMTTEGVVMLIKKDVRRSGYYSSGQKEWKWVPVEDKIDDTKIYYYCPMSGFQPEDHGGTAFDIVSLRYNMEKSGLKEFENLQVYGVRKSRIKELKERKNWVWIGDKVSEVAKKVSTKDIAKLVTASIINETSNAVSIDDAVAKKLPKDSLYAEFTEKYGDTTRPSGDISSLVSLCSLYGNVIDIEKIKTAIRKDKDALQNRYPLLKYLCNTAVKTHELATYITTVDKQEKI